MSRYEKHIDEWIYLIQGNHLPHCRDQELLVKDIEENGLTKMYGQQVKENPSPKQLPTVNRQMLALLQQLGISADNVSGGGGGYVPL